tara:strand:- start:1687 stop:3999 length:2313 start_codon:yes stop_codon:yes gene_type:complete
MFSVSQLLEKIPQNESIDSKKLQRILKLTKKNDKIKYEIAIDALNKIGILHKEEEQISSIVDDQFIEATLRCSSKGYSFAIRIDGGEDVYIREQNLNHALHGDKVLIKVSKEGFKRRSPEGKIQCILERKYKSILCQMICDGDNYFASPLDERILITILLDKNDPLIGEFNPGDIKLVEVELDKFAIAQYSAEGHIKRVLDHNGNLENDIDILVTKANINKYTKSPKILLKQPLQRNRIDLTNQPVLLFSEWKSKDAPQMPAFYIEEEANKYKLWIHTQTITERVILGNALDLSMRIKSETHCLVNEWINLLSDNLINESYFECGKSNDAISLYIEFDKSGLIKDWRFLLSKIEPISLITDTHLIAIANRKPRSRLLPVELKPIKEYIEQINSIKDLSVILNNNYKKDGLVELEENNLDISELGDIRIEPPVSDWKQWKPVHDSRSSHSVISPLIRVANYLSFNLISEFGLNGIAMVPVDTENTILNDVAKSAIALDVKLELNEEGVLSANELAEIFSANKSRKILDKLLKHAIPNPNISTIGNIAIDKEKPNQKDMLLNSAPYCLPTLHYYNHINQNIIYNIIKDNKFYTDNKVENSCFRKDDLVHKVVNNPKCIKFKNLLELEVSQKLVINLIQERARAKSLKYGIISMLQARLTQPLIGKEVDAIISGVQSYGFFAEIIPSGAEGLVHVSSLNDDWYEYRSRQSRLIGRKNKKVYQLGKEIKVRIVDLDIIRNQIDLRVVDQQFNSDDTDESEKRNPEDSTNPQEQS